VRFQRMSSHWVFLSSWVGGLILAPQGGMTLAQAVKRLKPMQEIARMGRFNLLLNELEGLFL